MIRAAGVLYAVGGRALFLKRSAVGDMAGTWCFPGGKVEGGESLEAAARREFTEETGGVIRGDLIEWTRRVAPNEMAAAPAAVGVVTHPPEQVDFTTFIAKDAEAFEPKVDGEHDGYAWAPLGSPPEPLHPGCRIALSRLTMNELDVARAIVAGDLVSPQRFENMWLFDLRITGTGVAYRNKIDEVAFRRPELYLNDEFLARCNGLVVIFEHPEDKTFLNSKEFSERAIGTVLLPYIDGVGARHPSDEVWGISKVYDDEAAELMINNQLSTSPAVKLIGSKTIVVDKEAEFYLEGNPIFLDHIAVCLLGVWDKGGQPSGIETVKPSGDQAMATEDDKKDARKDAADDRKDATGAEGDRKDAAGDKDAKKDAKKDGDDDVPGLIRNLTDAIGGIHARLDSVEKKFDARKDAEGDKKDPPDKDEKKDAADDKKDPDAKSDRKDAATDPDKKDAKKDAADDRKDAAGADVTIMRGEIDKIGATVKSVVDRLPIHMDDDAFAALSAAQERADFVFQAFGQQAPRPMQRETTAEYRNRVLGKLKPHSEAWAKVDLAKIADPVAFDVAEKQIFADAIHAASHPTDLKPGQLREITRRDRATGATITSFVGPESFIRGMRPGRRFVAKLNTQQERAAH